MSHDRFNVYKTTQYGGFLTKEAVNSIKETTKKNACYKQGLPYDYKTNECGQNPWLKEGEGILSGINKLNKYADDFYKDADDLDNMDIHTALRSKKKSRTGLGEVLKFTKGLKHLSYYAGKTAKGKLENT